VTITLAQLQGLTGRGLPGGSLVIEPYESAIADHALLAEGDHGDLAHPLWFVVTSLRCLGITVDELCALAGKTGADVLLFGECAIEQDHPLRVGGRYRTQAEVTAVDRRTTRDGGTLDSVEIRVALHGDDGPAGAVTSTYLFKRGAA
jgi:hypothetical protein